LESYFSWTDGVFTSEKKSAARGVTSSLLSVLELAAKGTVAAAHP